MLPLLLGCPALGIGFLSKRKNRSGRRRNEHRDIRLEQIGAGCRAVDVAADKRCRHDRRAADHDKQPATRFERSNETGIDGFKRCSHCDSTELTVWQLTGRVHAPQADIVDARFGQVSFSTGDEIGVNVDAGYRPRQSREAGRQIAGTGTDLEDIVVRLDIERLQNSADDRWAQHTLAVGQRYFAVRVSAVPHGGRYIPVARNAGDG